MDLQLVCVVCDERTGLTLITLDWDLFVFFSIYYLSQLECRDEMQVTLERSMRACISLPPSESHAFLLFYSQSLIFFPVPSSSFLLSWFLSLKIPVFSTPFPPPSLPQSCVLCSPTPPCVFLTFQSNLSLNFHFHRMLVTLLSLHPRMPICWIVTFRHVVAPPHTPLVLFSICTHPKCIKQYITVWI